MNNKTLNKKKRRKSMNKIILMGRLTAAPEVRTTGEKNVKVASFTLAVPRNGKSNDADFINITAWRHNADFAEKWLKKGTKIALVGRLRIDRRPQNDGSSRYFTTVEVDEMEFAESKGNSDTATATADEPAAAAATAAPESPAPAPEGGEEDGVQWPF